jgi:hypothetical protein
MCSMTSVTLKPRAKEAMTQTRRHIAMINQNHFTVVTTETDARYNEMMDKTACSERWVGKEQVGRETGEGVTIVR